MIIMNSQYSTNTLSMLINDYMLNNDKTQISNYIIKHKNKSGFILSYLNYLDNKHNTNIYLGLYNDALKITDKFTKRKQRNDSEYKKEVINLANNKCQLTGTHIKGCEVAHILDFQYCEYNCDKYSPYNGLLLKAQIHKYWDANYLKLNFNIKNETIYFTINYDKIKLEHDSETLIEDIKNELCYNTNYNASDEFFLTINNEYFNEYKYYISSRNTYYE